MKNNLDQVKSGGLPIISEDEQVQKNSMKLYVYLVSISQFQGRNKPRVFSQRDFSINKIHLTLGMHDTTIKKYWRLLEDNKLIKYEGPQAKGEDKLEQKEWNKVFMDRKKNKASFYSIPKSIKDYKYRIIPKETIEKIQTQFLVSEQELKLYLLLANMQEHFCYMQSPNNIFTIADLRILLKLSKNTANNKAIALSLIWLQKLKLIEYTIETQMTNLNIPQNIFRLKSVNYYTNGGEINSYIDNDYTVISDELKNNILNEQLVKIDYEDLL